MPINEEIKSHVSHISPLWWVEQDPILKPEGRFLGDLTNREAGSPLVGLQFFHRFILFLSFCIYSIMIRSLSFEDAFLIVSMRFGLFYRIVLLLSFYNSFVMILRFYFFRCVLILLPGCTSFVVL